MSDMPLPHAVQASPKDFAQYGVEATQQFVSVPTVEHILVEQPVTFKQYKQKTSYVQVPVPQKYSKLVMNHQNQQQQSPQQQQLAPQQDYIPTVAGLDKPVYGCQAGPFQERAWGGFAPDDAGFVVPPPGMVDVLAPRAVNVGPSVFSPSQYYYGGGPMASPAYAPMAAGFAPRVNSYAALY
jgi:hypothetical protein